MEPSPYRERFSRLLPRALPLTATFYRAIPPNPGGSALEPGYGFQAGNRYNPPGVLSALYFADDRPRAPLEANLSAGWFDIFEVEIRGLPGVAALDDANLALLGLNRAEVTRSRLDSRAYRICQQLGAGAFQAGGSGLLFPSALPGAPAGARNLVLFCAPFIARAGIRVTRV